jgi:hypothetical protein
MPIFDARRMIINNIQLSVPEYLRLLASDSQYASSREQLLEWAVLYEQQHNITTVEF